MTYQGHIHSNCSVLFLKRSQADLMIGMTELLPFIPYGVNKKKHFAECNNPVLSPTCSLKAPHKKEVY